MGFSLFKVNTGEKRPSTIAFKVLLILVSILLSPKVAEASVIAQQLDNSTSLTNCQNNNCRQIIGDGYTGTLSSLVVESKMSGGFGSLDIQGAVWEWATAYDGDLAHMATSTDCGLQAGQTNSDGNPQSTLNGPTYLSTNTISVGTTQAQQTYTFSGLQFKPQCHYWIGTQRQSTTPFGSEIIYGSATSTAFLTSSEDLIPGTSGVKDIYFIMDGDETDPDGTRIIYFHPLEGTTEATSSVHFDIYAYIDPEDVGSIQGVRISLHNINQNTLGWLLGDFAPDDFDIVNENLQVPGFFYAATDTPIAVGNYRVRACLKRTYFFGWIQNNFANVIDNERDCQSHQFVVGTSTFVGFLSQNGFSEYNDFVNGLSATSTEALSRTCNPINSDFGIRECLTYLLIPGGDALDNTLQGLREGILIRVPWGYFTRAATILSNPATSTLPSWTASIRIASSTYTTLTFDPGDMFAGAGTLVDSIRDPVYGVNLRDIFYTICQLIVAIGVIMTIFSDITKSHGHNQEHNGRE